MYCPQCGQQQVSEVVRFCSKCGFPLDGVIQLLANGGMLPAYQPAGPREPSPRLKGVRQGGILLLTGILLVPILGVFAHYAVNSNFLEILTAIASILCFVGGPLRMLYAALFEEGGPGWQKIGPAYAQPQVTLQSGIPSRASLPPPAGHQSPGWNARPRTAELVRPTSVTEGTTRLLDKDDPTKRQGN